jgi:molybdate transport system substrate-binding protein
MAYVIAACEEISVKSTQKPNRSRWLVAITVAIAIVAGLVCEAGADEVTVAAAADLTFAFKDVAAQFQEQSGTQVKLSFGSSGNFFSQIQNGAPFDLFFSADLSYARKLADAGLAEPGSLYEYAIGKIVLWVPSGSKLDLSTGLHVLNDPAIRKIAIANPEHAPYGRAAVEAMRHEGVYDPIKDKLVLGENISQTAQFVQSGNADIGIIALSLAMAPGMKEHGRYLEIPAADYSPIEQGAVILKSSRKKDLARKFLTFLKTPATAALMERYGFAIPKTAANNPK